MPEEIEGGSERLRKDDLLNLYVSHTKKGVIDGASLHNVQLALREGLNVEAAIDTFAGTMHYRFDKGDWEEFTDDTVDHLRSQLSHLHEGMTFNVSAAAVRSALNVLTKRADSAQRWIAKLPKWDQVPRLSTWMERVWGVEESDLNQWAAEAIFVSIVRRQRYPGSKFDVMVTLTSPGGYGKTSVLKMICPKPEWYASDELHTDTKKFIESTRGKLLFEWAEAAGMKRGDIEKVKHIASSTTDAARLAYDRATTSVPRRCTIVITTNETQFLRDDTGNRRFVVVELRKAAREKEFRWLIENREQLWAEAAWMEAQQTKVNLAAFDAGHLLDSPKEAASFLNYEIPESLWDAAAEKAEEHRFISDVEDFIWEAARRAKRGWVSRAQITKMLIDNRAQSADYKAIRRGMQRAGFEERKTRMGDDFVRIWIKGHKDMLELSTKAKGKWYDKYHLHFGHGDNDSGNRIGLYVNEVGGTSDESIEAADELAKKAARKKGE